MNALQSQLFENQDLEYKKFHLNLVPGMAEDHVIGVRVPILRKIAKDFAKTDECEAFLRSLPHRYYDENMIHVIVLSGMKDYEECVKEVDAILPYVDNWAMCDTLSPKVFKKHRPELLEKIREWAASDKTYTCRFGIDMLMSHFLDDDFDPELLEIPANIRSEEYYINMMIAWFFATALAKQWDATIPYLLENRMDVWTHNKTIQKARESYRITPEQKAYLKTLKR